MARLSGSASDRRANRGTACGRWAPGAALVLAAFPVMAAPERDYRFDLTISRPVLESYLSRAITMMDLCTGRGDVDDNIRMLKSIGAKFAGRVLYLWGKEKRLPELLKKAQVIEAKVHAADPEMILQAGIFEIVTTRVNDIPIPGAVFRDLGLPVERRNFRYDDMLYEGGEYKDHWFKGGSVPDIRRRETRLWFHHLAMAYVDVGVEAIHYGQVALVGAKDTGWTHWQETLSRARAYAAKNARRHLLICDAHTPGGGPRVGENLLFDFHSFPLRIKEVPGQPLKGILEQGFHDSFFGRSRGGVTPSGWACKSLPYLVEFDNWGSSGKGGQPGVPWYTWGYDEIDWFARQPEAERNAWLVYAWNFVRETDPNGFLQMPGSRILHDPVDGKHWYHANGRATFPEGFNQEEAIRKIWEADG